MALTAEESARNGLDVDRLLPDGMHHIGGEWVAGRSGETIDVVNPATGETLHRVPRGGADDVDAAARAASDAFPAWRDTSPTRRGDLLRAWGKVCQEHAEELDLLERLEVGRPSWGPSGLSRMLEYFAGLADKVHGTTLPSAVPDVIGLTIREPYGVCGSIIPWNTPGPLTVADVAPAIAAGNTIIVKPAEDAPLTPLLLARLALEAGIPAGVVNVVTGYGNEAGQALPLHPLVRRMSFTGSPETGRKVMAGCAQSLIPLHLELGGKSPQVLFADAALERAIPTIVRSITFNTGQICAAGSRLVVDERIRAQVVDAVTEGFSHVRVGPWWQDVDMGPLISARQEQRVLGYLDAGQQEGARLVTGGHKIEHDGMERGYFVEPTIFDDVRSDMRIAQEEIFGPVLSVLGFEDEEEALQIANGTNYGLVAGVWTSDVGRAMRLARRIEAGSIAVNSFWSGGVIGAPHGGYKMSGFGRTMSADAVLEHTQVKTVVINATA